MLEISEMLNAARVLAPVTRHTPIVEAPKLNPEANIWLEPANLRFMEPFKLRDVYDGTYARAVELVIQFFTGNELRKNDFY